MKFVIVNQNEPTTELYHFGIKGQKWGIRRFQNPDGTLTAAGRKRYLNSDGTLTKKGEKASSKNPELKKTIDKAKSGRQVINDYKKDGWDLSTFDKDDDSYYALKEFKTKNGKVAMSTLLNSFKGADNISTSEMNKHAKHVVKNYDKMNNMCVKEFEKEKRDWFSGMDIGKVEQVDVTKFPNGTMIIEAISPVTSEGKTYGWYYTTFDGKTGKVLETTYND